MTQPFTVDDLTSREYGEVARLIKGDPTKALVDPDSTKAADALAGVLLMRERRTAPGHAWESVRDLTMGQIQRALGLIGDSEPAVDPAAASSGATDLADQAADQIGAGDLDPTDRPDSPPSES